MVYDKHGGEWALVKDETSGEIVPFLLTEMEPVDHGGVIGLCVRGRRCLVDDGDDFPWVEEPPHTADREWIQCKSVVAQESDEDALTGALRMFIAPCPADQD